MNSTPRKVKFSTIMSLLKKKQIALFFGLLFSFFALLMFVIFTLIFSFTGNDSPKIDYELIDSQGIETSAEVTDIEVESNVTINDIHPTIISYQYFKNNEAVRSKYKVLEGERIEALQVGDNLAIKELNGQSIIQNLKPYRFPVALLFLIPIPFMLFGLPFLMYLFISTRKELKLYKYGQVATARIVSMMPKYAIPIINLGQGVIVHYEYETRSGNKVIGESLTTDFSIISDKRTGDEVSIFVAANNEAQSCLIPKLESLRNNWDIVPV